MPSPFPGMDPYLEDPNLWPDVHNELIGALRALLVPALRPRYYVAIEERTYTDEAPELALVGMPDVSVVSRSSGDSAPLHRAAASSVALPVRVPLPHAVHETYLEVRGLEAGDGVAVIEILSLSNKRPGEGRRLYLEKRRKILTSLTHLIEIDLLRAGERMPIEGIPAGSHYLVLVSPATERPGARLHALGVREPLPVFSLPLREPGEDVAIDLAAVLATAYERAAYDLRIDYSRAPQPRLDPDDDLWAAGWLRDQRERR